MAMSEIISVMSEGNQSRIVGEGHVVSPDGFPLAPCATEFDLIERYGDYKAIGLPFTIRKWASFEDKRCQAPSDSARRQDPAMRAHYIAKTVGFTNLLAIDQYLFERPSINA